MHYDIYLTGTVGWDFTAREVEKQLQAYEGKECHIYLSSLGGSLIDGLSIYQLLRTHAHTTVHLFGFNASAATLLAMGAKKVIMSQFSLFLVHGCSQLVEGWAYMNAEEIAQHIAQAQEQKEAADTMDRLMASIYAHRATAEPNTMLATMKEARWLTAQEVLDLGLIDTIDTEEGQSTDTQMTAALTARFVAKGYPIPQKNTPTMNTQEPTPNTPTPEAQENKTLLARLAQALGITSDNPPTPQEKEQDGAETETKADTQPTEQATAEEVETLKAQIQAQAAEIESLKAQLQAQGAEDGDQSTTQATEAPTTEAQDDSPAAQARAAYDRMKGIL